MRVLQVHTSYREPGGEDEVATAEADLLRQHGHEVVQHWRTNPGTPRQTITALARAPYNHQAADAVRQVAAVAAHRPDVAHIHNTWFAQSGAVVHALHRLDIPVVATVHNYRFACVDGTFFRSGRTCVDCLGRSPVPGVVHRCYRDSVTLSAIAGAAIVTSRRMRTWTQAVDRLIAPSETVRLALLHAGAAPERVIVKPHFVADPGPRLAPPSASSDVLYVGRLAPGKGLDVLLKAWRRVSLRHLRLLIIGDGPLREQLQGAAPPNTCFLGHQSRDDVRARMLSARALAFPSTWPEPFGMVLIEALAAGLPIVGTDAGSARAIVAPEPPELLIHPGDPESLAAALSLVDSADCMDSAGGVARLRYLGSFTPRATLPQLLAIYRSAAA